MEEAQYPLSEEISLILNWLDHAVVISVGALHFTASGPLSVGCGVAVEKCWHPDMKSTEPHSLANLI